MNRRLVLGALAAALMPFGLTRGTAQPAGAPDRTEREALRPQKRAVKRLRHTQKKWIKRRRRKAKQALERTEMGEVRVHR